MFFCLLQYLSKYCLLQPILSNYGIEAGFDMPGARKISLFLLGLGSHLGFSHSTISTSQHCYHLCSVVHLAHQGRGMRVSVVWSKLATCHLCNLPINCPDHCPRASSQLRSLAQFLLFPTLLAIGLSCVLGCAFAFQFNHIYLFRLSETYFWSSSVLTSYFFFCFFLFL